MKLLTVSTLLCALLALSYAADSQEETATQEEAKEEEPESDADTLEPSHVVKRAFFSPRRWKPPSLQRKGVKAPSSAKAGQQKQADNKSKTRGLVSEIFQHSNLELPGKNNPNSNCYCPCNNRN